MRRLHRGDDAERGEARDVVRRHDDLGVLDAVTARPAACLRDGALVRVEHDPVGAVADGVRVHLQVAAHRPFYDLSEIIGRGDEEARVAGFVAVVCEQGRAPAAERAVHVELDRADREPPGIVEERAGLAEVVQRLPRPADHRVEPNRELLGVGGGAVERDRREVDARFVDAGETVARGLGERPLHPQLPLHVRRWRDETPDERHRGIDEHSGRATVGVADDAAAVGIGHRVEAVHEHERGRVRPRGVPVDASDPHGPVGECRVEVGGGGERAVAAPIILVPAAARHPRAVRQREGEALQPLDDILLRDRPHEVGLQERSAEVHEVGVRIDEAGHDRAAPGVELAGIGVGREHVGLGPDGEDQAPVEGERFGGGLRRIDGVNRGVVEDGRLRVRRGGGQREHGEQEESEHGRERE